MAKRFFFLNKNHRYSLNLSKLLFFPQGFGSEFIETGSDTLFVIFGANKIKRLKKLRERGGDRGGSPPARNIISAPLLTCPVPRPLCYNIFLFL